MKENVDISKLRQIVKRYESSAETHELAAESYAKEGNSDMEAHELKLARACRQNAHSFKQRMKKTLSEISD